MSAWRKFSVGPMAKSTCRNCGGAIRVAWFPATLVLLLSSFIPFAGLFAVAFAGTFTSLWAMGALFIVGCGAGTLASIWLYHHVPFKAV